jgi:hypothetical protein
MAIEVANKNDKAPIASSIRLSDVRRRLMRRMRLSI